MFVPRSGIECNLHVVAHCLTCQYDLRSLDPHGRCPECGEPISRACLSCGLNVQGLDPSGYCPRCGVPITPVPDEHRLHKADPVWLETIDRGMTLLRAGFFGVLIGFATIVLPWMWFIGGAMAFGFGSPPTWLEWIVNAISFCGMALFFLSWLPLFYGLWKLATPEPKPPIGLDTHDRALRVLTVLAIPALVLPPVIWFTALSASRGTGLSWPTMIMWTIELPCMIALVLHAMVFVRFLEYLERRSGSLRAKRARVLAQYRIAPLGFGIVALFAMAMFIFTFANHTGSAQAPVFPMSGMVSGVWFLGLGLIGKTRRDVRRGLADPQSAYVVSRESLPTA